MTPIDFTPFLLTYRLAPRPDRVSDLLTAVLRYRLLYFDKTELPAAAALLALAEKHPEHAEEWRRMFPNEFRVTKQVCNTSPERPGWNDWYAVRWGVIGRREDLDEIVRASRGPEEGPLAGKTFSARMLLDVLRKPEYDPDGAATAIIREDLGL